MRDHSQKMALSPTQRLEIGKREKAIVSSALHFSLSPASLQHKKGFGYGGEREWLTTKSGLPSGSLAFFHASKVDQRPFFVARGGILRARHMGEIAGTQGIGRFL